MLKVGREVRKKKKKKENHLRQIPQMSCVRKKYGKYVLWYHIIFLNTSARVGYDTRLIFKQSLTGLKSEFSFS